MFGDWIRRTGFWTLDFARGGKIRNNYLDIKRRMADGSCNEEQLYKLMNHTLRQYLFIMMSKPKS